LCGKRGGKLAARADAELGEDLAQVVGDGGAADEQLRGDLRVGGAVGGQAGDQLFLRGQGVWRRGGAFADLAAACAQLDAGPFGERRGADRAEDLVGAGELVAGVAPAALAAQPLAVDQVGAPQFHALANTAEAVDRLTVQAFSILAVAGQRPRAGLDTERPVGPAGAGDAGQPLQGAGRARGYAAARRRLDHLGERPVGVVRRGRVLARPLRGCQRFLMPAQAIAQHRGRPLREAQR
jgi:hypothetical protein